MPGEVWGWLAAAQPGARRRIGAGRAERTLVLAVLRGALLDLLATGDVERTTAAVHRMVAALKLDPELGWRSRVGDRRTL